jgi:signal transduction histidine kinase
MGGVELRDDTLVVEREPNGLDDLAIEFSSLLSARGVDHVFVAGYVVILTGRARSTQDIDERERVDLAEAVERAWNTTVTEDATLEHDGPLQSVEGDGTRLVTLFENLFANAVEHAGEDVTVRVGSLDDGFYVADDGPGIPQEDREEIFESGYTTSETGTGFGLSIVESVADAHGWSVGVTEGEDGGARFEFTGVDVLKTPESG